MKIRRSKKIVLKILIGFAGLVILYIFCIGIACIPGLFLLSEEKTTTIDGVTTFEEAVLACRGSGCEGWDLVEYAQKLTARKFTYSRRNSWESPEKAFARGQGYCVQQALVLNRIYKGMGIESKVVHGKGDFPDSVIHGVSELGGNFNHTWLEVTINGETLYVCPGSASNSPGNLDFTITGKVKPYTKIMHFFTYPGAILINAIRDFRATRFRKESIPHPAQSGA